jgi:NAD(P)-dependent dehydrogenase (short-subunit alcohol dehydrogenase family)
MRESSYYRHIVAILCYGLVATRALNIAITGTSQGIGLSAARSLIADGHRVFHGCRSEQRAALARDEANGGEALVCDLADTASVRKFAKEVAAACGDEGLDVLCLNAGIAPSTKAEAAGRTVQGFEECVGTNHLGHFLLAHELLPALEKGAGDTMGTIVVTASSVHDPEQPGGAVGGKDGASLGDLSGVGAYMTGLWGSAAGDVVMPDGATEYSGGKVYKDSKLMNVMFARAATKKWAQRVRLLSFNPGFIPSSGLFRAPRKDNAVGAALFTFVATNVAKFAVPIDVGGDRLAFLAASPEAAALPSGSYLSADTGSLAVTPGEGFIDGIISAEAQDDAKVEELWQKSVEVLGL